MKNLPLSRPTWIEIDLDAVEHNVHTARDLVAKNVKLYGVCKADAMGCGLTKIAQTFAEAGIDGLAVSDPADVVKLREADVTAPILLFASTLPEQAADVAALDAIPVIHDFESLEAFARLQRPLEIFCKIDSGMGRLGFTEVSWTRAVTQLAAAPQLKLKGLYTHMSKPDDREVTANQADRFERACNVATSHGLAPFEKMAASSRVLLGYPEYHYSAADPGRLLLGMLDSPWAEMAPTRPVIRALKSRVIQVQEHAPGTQLGIGYGKPINSRSLIRTAVIPIGFSDGLNHAPPLGEVIICGKRAPVLGRRSIEFSLLDVTGISGVEVGSEVVLLGEQENERITAIELAKTLNLPTLELLPRIAHNTTRVYVRN